MSKISAPTTLVPTAATAAPKADKVVKAATSSLSQVAAPAPKPVISAPAPKVEPKFAAPKAEKSNRPKCASAADCAELRKEVKDTDLITPVGDIKARVGCIRYQLMDLIRKSATVGAAKKQVAHKGDKEIKVTHVDVGFALANGMIKVTAASPAPEPSK